MRLSIFYGNRWWARVHQARCREFGPEHRRDGSGAGSFDMDAETQRQAIEGAAGDFIFGNDQQPWTDYIGQVSFAPP